MECSPPLPLAAFDPSPVPFVILMAAGFLLGGIGSHVYRSSTLIATGIGLIFLATLGLPLAIYLSDRYGRLRPCRSWALTHSSATIAEPSESSPQSTVAAMISANLRTLPVAVAAEQLQALALGREPGAAAVGRDDQRRDRDRVVVVAVRRAARRRRRPPRTRRRWRRPARWR